MKSNSKEEIKQILKEESKRSKSMIPMKPIREKLNLDS